MPNIIFNKRDYILLEALIERNCTTPVASLSIKQLINITKMSDSKVRSVKDNFIMMGYLLEGSKDGNNKTFYVTEDGIEHYKTTFGFDEKKIVEMMNDWEDNYKKEMNKGDK